ncbi:unnamed protein product [Nyctereutes procyonoides]|uniref:(raccoon dog) hypothetical protein n=1 Tax=Nyctereutes procyonoides TaxID=34880 RepID=A0A811ZEA0_NYCPR|nr:unnamed protein product [Nyctereutes procyonoides]
MAYIGFLQREAGGAAVAGILAGQAVRKFLPLFDLSFTTVVAVGLGSKGKGGEIEPVSVKVGNKVLLPEYGGTKVVVDDKDYFLFRDGDILGKYVD